MRIVVIFILFANILFAKLPNVTIFLVDSNNKPIQVSKQRDKFSNAFAKIKKHKKAKLYVVFLDGFVDKGVYYLTISSAPNIKNCYKFLYSNTICPINYSGGNKTYSYLLEAKSKDIYLRGAKVDYEENFFAWQDRVIKKYLIAIFILGILFMALIYSLMLYFSLLNSLYLYYAFLQLSFILYAIVHLNLFALGDYINFVWFINSLTLALLTLFAVKFMKYTNIFSRFCKVLYLVVAYAFINAILAIFGFLYPFYGSFFVPVILLCLLRGVRKKEVLLYILAIVTIIAGVIVIEFFQSVWINYIHPMVIILPIEALLMLGAISIFLKKLEQKRKDYQNLLIHTSKEKSLSVIVASIFHNFKNRLSRLSFILMQMQLDKSSIDSKIKSLEDEIYNLNITIKKYLQLYGSDKKDNKKANLKELVENVIDSFERKDISFKIDINSNIEVKNSWAIKEILIILLSNSIEAFTQNSIENRVITISYNNKNLTICDNAGGIKEDINLSTPTQSSKESGTGIGLYIANIIAKEYCNSTLEIKSIKDGICAKLMIN